MYAHGFMHVGVRKWMCAHGFMHAGVCTWVYMHVHGCMSMYMGVKECT